MKLSAHQLATHLTQGLCPIYFLFGDDPYQKTDVAEAIRKKAIEEGITERERFDVATGFNWERWYHSTQECSLFSVFSEKRLIECHLAEALNPLKTIGPMGAKVLYDLMQKPPSDIVFLITSPKLDTSMLSSQWFKSIDSKGVTILCRSTPESNAQFSVFDLVDAVFLPSLPKTQCIFAYLKHTVDPTLVLWALIRKVRTTHSNATFNRLHMLQKAQDIDTIIKGYTPGNAWNALYFFCLCLLGVKTLNV